MTDTTTATPDPCECGEVHEAPDLSGMSADRLHAIATAALGKAADEVIKAEPGRYPDLEKALQAIGYTATLVLRERLMASVLGQGRDIVETSARKSREATTGQAALPFPGDGSGAYL